MIKISLLLALVVALVCLSVSIDAGAGNQQTLLRPATMLHRTRRDTSHRDKHHSMMHNHLSRKVFDRACAASKDTIDEIIACLTANPIILKAVKENQAKDCYKDAFGQDFDPKDVTKHKELICTNRDKFENMTTCVYTKTAESIDPKELEKMTEAMVDVGLCIINALDG